MFSFNFVAAAVALAAVGSTLAVPITSRSPLAVSPDDPARFDSFPPTSTIRLDGKPVTISNGFSARELDHELHARSPILAGLAQGLDDMPASGPSTVPDISPEAGPFKAGPFEFFSD